MKNAYVTAKSDSPVMTTVVRVKPSTVSIKKIYIKTANIFNPLILAHREVNFLIES